MQNKLTPKLDLSTKQSEFRQSPDLLSPPLSGTHPQPGPLVSTSKCYRRVSPQPQHLPAIRVPSSGVPFSPELGLGTGCSGLEKLSQRGGLPGAGCDGKVGHMRESPCAQVSRQKSEKRR